MNVYAYRHLLPLYQDNCFEIIFFLFSIQEAITSLEIQQLDFDPSLMNEYYKKRLQKYPLCYWLANTLKKAGFCGPSYINLTCRERTFVSSAGL